MLNIEEVRIPREKEPLFIDYSKLYGDSKKKLIFLRALIQIINTRADFIEFNDLKLSPDDKKLFADYLKKHYPENFDPKKNKINLFENYEGKIICGVDQMIEDLFTILSMENKTLDLPPSEKPENVVQKQNVDDGYKEEILSYSIFEIFYDWIFLEKYEKENFESESKMYLKEFFAFSESDLKNNFNIQRITDEILKNFTKLKIKRTLIVKIRAKLISCLEELEKHSSDKGYWSNLITDTKKIFKNLIDATTILNNEKMKLFLTFPGNPHIQNINMVVGNYKNKTVLFQKDSPLFPNLEKKQIVQGEIKNERDNVFFVYPIRIIDFNETKMLMLFGVEAAPSNEYVMHFLDNNS
jgi:hypothetical protein